MHDTFDPNAPANCRRHFRPPRQAGGLPGRPHPRALGSHGVVRVGNRRRSRRHSAREPSGGPPRPRHRKALRIRASPCCRSPKPCAPGATRRRPSPRVVIEKGGAHGDRSAPREPRAGQPPGSPPERLGGERNPGVARLRQDRGHRGRRPFGAARAPSRRSPTRTRASGSSTSTRTRTCVSPTRASPSRTPRSWTT